MRRKTEVAQAVVLGALAFLAAPAAASAIPVSNADALVREAADAPKHVSYVGQVATTRYGVSRAEATIARVEHRAPSQTRRTYLAPEAIYGQYSVTHGATTGLVDPTRKLVTVSENPAAEDSIARNDNLALLAANYRAVGGATESVANRPALTVSLINKHTGQTVMRVWIDAATKLLLGKEEYHADGSIAWRMRYDEIRYTATLPDAVFSAPRGFTEVQGRKYSAPSTDLERTLTGAGFTPASPRYLPDGFAIVGADVSEIKGIKSLHLLYSDGIRQLSLFQNAGAAAADFGTLHAHPTKVEDHDGQYVKDGPTTLLAWREHGLAFALVGDLDLRELLAIAASVVP